ncbi:MAG: glutamine--fructose-6-phosphate transaminase (isomerizing) [Candidatus Hadarchaeales archaeon]
MCGIIGYVGTRKAAPLLLEGLRRLEYRGYDSAGIATLEGKLWVKKDAGKLEEIERRLGLSSLPGRVGIGHVRWATHGSPTRRNAHPHLDDSGEVAVVHNGIIENYLELRKVLERKGHRFVSETDTEVIPHLISHFLRKGEGLERSVERAVGELKGSLAMAVLYVGEPEKLIGVRRNSPLLVGKGEGESFLASDIPALLPFTRKVVPLQEEEMVVLTPSSFSLRHLPSRKTIERKPMTVKWTAEMAEKGGYPHFTLKEIFEQPWAVGETLRGAGEEVGKLSSFLLRAERLYFVGCGTSYHAAVVGKYLLAKLAGLPVEAVVASEFSESCGGDGRTAILAISQSGETADVLRAVRTVRAFGGKVACLTNVVGSSVTRESQLSCYIRAGPEVSVVATKTFTSQVAYLLLLSLELGEESGRLGRGEKKELLSDLLGSPKLMESTLRPSMRKTKALAREMLREEHLYLVGRGLGYPIAMEGALKVKEISYQHAEALAGGELKHGTLALLEKGTPVIGVAVPGETKGKLMNNLEEMRARGARIIAVAEEGDGEVEEHADLLLPVSKTGEFLSPLTFILPLQLLAYHLSVGRGLDPDRPRSLAKSVTVE